MNNTFTKSFQAVSVDVLSGKTQVKNTMFAYEWTIENIEPFFERMFEISSPTFGSTSKDGTEWKLVMHQKLTYPKGPCMFVSLVKVSNDMNPVGVIYSIYIVSLNSVQLIQTKEKNFRQRGDFDECEVIYLSELAKKELLIDNSLTIRCEMDLIYFEDSSISKNFSMMSDENKDFRSRNINSDTSSQHKVINKFVGTSFNNLDEESGDESETCTNTQSAIPTNLFTKQRNLTQKDSVKDLLTDFESLYTKKLFCDITIVCAGSSLTAHRAILSARSDYFKKLCDKEANRSGHIVLPGVKGPVMEAVLYYIYTGKIMCSKSDFALDLYSASKKFNLTKLELLVFDFLKSNITVENVTEMLQACESLNLVDLKYACLKFANSNKSDVMKTEKWDWLMENNPHIAGEVLLTMASFQKRNVL